MTWPESEPEMTLEEFRAFMQYAEIKEIGDGEYAATMPMMFTCAIVLGRLDDVTGYSKRWCYESGLAAAAALRVWDGQGEPVGWHRAPHTGMRVSRTGMEIDGHGQRVSGPGVTYWYP